LSVCLTLSFQNEKFNADQENYLGCFNDAGDRALPIFKGSGKSTDQCSKLCDGYQYYARQWTGECWCGNTAYNKYGIGSGCDCHGSNVGGWKQCVYKATDGSTNDGDDCDTLGFDGQCINLQNSLQAGLKDSFCNNGDDSACDIYKNIFEPLIEITKTFLDLPNFMGCLGDFSGTQVNEVETSDELGCPNIPVSSSLKYGIIASSLTITTQMQLQLQSMRLWDIPGEAVTPSFCLAVKDPSCGIFTLGISLNGDTLATIAQVTPAGNPVIDTVIALLGEAAEAGLDQITFALSSNGGLEVPIRVYSPNIGWKEATVLANIHFEVVAGIVDLPFLDSEYSASLVEIKAGFTRSIAFGNINENTFTDALSDPLSSGSDIAKGYSEAITMNGEVSFGLSTITHGLLPDLEASISAQAYMVGNSASQTEFSLPAGLYMNIVVEDIPFISNLVNELCNFYSGAMDVLGAAISCPDISVNVEAKLGIFIQTEALGIVISAGDVNLKCYAKKINTLQPSVNCNFLEALFQIFWNGVEYVISEIEDFADDVGKEVFKIGEATFNEFGDGVIGFGKDVTNVAEDVGEGFIEGTGCVLQIVTDAAECGYKTVQCGWKSVTSGAECGFDTVTDGAVCGFHTVTDGAICGYDTVTNGAICGVTSVCSWLGLCSGSAKSCEVASSCDIANTCEIPSTCNIPNYCQEIASCEVEVCR